MPTVSQPRYFYKNAEEMANFLPEAPLSKEPTSLIFQIVGERQSGKSLLINRFIDPLTHPEFYPTSAIKSTRLDIDNKKISCLFYEARDEHPYWNKNANAIILTLDLTNPHALNRLEHVLKKMKESELSHVKWIVVGTKADKTRQVTEDQLNDWLSSHPEINAYIETSAYNQPSCPNIRLAFLLTADLIIKEQNAELLANEVHPTSQHEGALSIADHPSTLPQDLAVVEAESTKAKSTDKEVVVYNALVKLTDNYLKKHDLDPAKKALFEGFKNALNTPAATHLERIVAFKQTLDVADKTLLSQHRTSSWKRFLLDALSILTVIPALIRACHSRAQSGRFQFWNANSENTTASMHDEVHKVEGRTIAG